MNKKRRVQSESEEGSSFASSHQIEQAHSLTPDELDDLREAFDLFDNDGDK
jgi:Ca2+-binding EF-hand superfamily protein